MTESYSERDHQVPCDSCDVRDTGIKLETVKGTTLDESDDVLFGCNKCDATFSDPDDLSNHAATAGCDCTDDTDSDDVTETKTPTYIVVSESDSEDSSDFEMTESLKTQNGPNPVSLRSDANEIILARDDCRAIVIDGSLWQLLPNTSVQCKICRFEVAASDFEFVRPRHEMCHSGERMYMCTQCGAGYKNESTLRDHWRMKHKQNGVGHSLHCNECDSCFVHQHKLNEHVRLVHTFQCRNCHEQFQTGHELKDHMRCHGGRCLVCRKWFKTDDKLKKHLQTGCKRRSKFECSICKMLFTVRFTLERHMRRHTPPSFTCDLCTEQFTFHYELYMHTALTHIGRIMCIVCSTNFTNASPELKEHLLVHTGELSAKSACRKSVSKMSTKP